MILRDVHSTLTAKHLLFALLKERRPEQSISHMSMPTWEEHVTFVRSQPYEHWYLIEADGYFRGSVYLTRQREIGVAIFEGCRGQHYAEDAVGELMRLHPGRFLANIAPGNAASLALFAKLGFTGPIQVTLEKT